MTEAAKTSPRAVLVAMPTTHGVVCTATVASLLNLQRDLLAQGYWMELVNIDSADAALARSMFATQFLHDLRFEALVFIDSDMSFASDVVCKLLLSGHEVTGAVYPKRFLNLAKFARNIVEAGSGKFQHAAALSYDFTVLPSWDEVAAQSNTEDEYLKVAAIGMGITVIRRSALVDMVSSGAVQERMSITSGSGTNYFGFFEPVVLGSVVLSEDFSFCYRWTKVLGRDLFAKIDVAIAHIGPAVHVAAYRDRF